MSFWPGLTGSGPAPVVQGKPRLGLPSVFLMVSNGVGGGLLPTAVLTDADVLLSSFVSAIVLSGSTTAVLVMEPATPGAVALIVIVPFWP